MRVALLDDKALAALAIDVSGVFHCVVAQPRRMVPHQSITDLTNHHKENLQGCQHNQQVSSSSWLPTTTFYVLAEMATKAG